MLNLQKIIGHLVSDIKIPKNRIAELLECDPKLVTKIIKAEHGFRVIEVPADKTMRSGT